ncbi:hypothetical protein BgiMline_002142, partial [Biomphalaria glabrata]
DDPYIEDWPDCENSHNHKYFEKIIDFNGTDFQNDPLMIKFLITNFNLVFRIEISSFSERRKGHYRTLAKEGVGSGRFIACKKLNYHYLMYLATAKHCVYNSFEANCSRIQLNYDEVDRESNFSVFNLMNSNVVASSFKEDWTIIKVDLPQCGLTRSIYNSLKEFKMISRLHKAHKYFDSTPNCYLIGHPHGCIKYWSKGKLEKLPKSKKFKKKDLRSKPHEIYYSLASCPATSGGTLIVDNSFQSICIHQGRNCQYGYGTAIKSHFIPRKMPANVF